MNKVIWRFDGKEVTDDMEQELKKAFPYQMHTHTNTAVPQSRVSENVYLIECSHCGQVSNPRKPCEYCGAPIKGAALGLNWRTATG